MKRDRAPSRVNVKKMMIAMKSRILRQKMKATVRKIAPRSLLFYYLATNYTWWRLEYHIRSDCFFTKYFFRGLKKKVHYRPLASNCRCLKRACLCLKGAVKQKQSSIFIFFRATNLYVVMNLFQRNSFWWREGFYYLVMLN